MGCSDTDNDPKLLVKNRDSTPEHHSCAQNSIMEVETVVDKAAELLTTLNFAICSCHGSHCSESSISLIQLALWYNYPVGSLNAVLNKSLQYTK